MAVARRPLARLSRGGRAAPCGLTTCLVLAGTRGLVRLVTGLLQRGRTVTPQFFAATGVAASTRFSGAVFGAPGGGAGFGRSGSLVGSSMTS
jgi:hypothetical protein